MVKEVTTLRDIEIRSDDVFFASYPKSGNTWLRYMLACLLHPENEIKLSQLDGFLPDIYAHSHDELANLSGPRLLKTHDCFDPRCQKVIYIVRDPRDVAISYYYYQLKHGFLAQDYPLGSYIHQFCQSPGGGFGSWQENIGSWLGARQSNSDFMLLRYEDMLMNPEKSLTEVIKHLGWQYSRKQIQVAVEAGCFSRMQQLEHAEKEVWRESRNSQCDVLFMRSGKHGQWTSELTDEHVAEIESSWGDLMLELGYELTAAPLSDENNIHVNENTVMATKAAPEAEIPCPKIVTSIAPHGLAHQQQAIASWQALGYQVVSLNCAEEIDIIGDAFAHVDFVEVNRDGRSQTGRPLIYFDDILDYYRRSDEPICAIVNSDILLKEDRSFCDIINREASNSLVYGSRVDVQDMNNRAGGVYRGGFDFFFFPRAFLDLYPQSTFMVGMPWWDYWVPTIALLKGMAVKRLDSFYAFHEIHKINYSEERYLEFGQQFAMLIRSLLSTETEAEFPLLNDIETVDIPRLGASTTRFLEKYSLSLTKASYDAASDNESGERLFAEGLYEQALSCFQQALHTSPEDVRSLNNLAVLCWQLGDQEATLTFARQAYQIAPEDRHTVFNFIDIQSAREQYDEALRACQHYLTVWPYDEEMRELESVLKKSLAARMESALEDLVSGL